MQDNLSERIDTKGDKESERKILGEGIFNRKFIFGSKEQKNKECWKFSGFKVGNSKEIDDRCGDVVGSGKLNNNITSFPSLPQKTWVFSTPCIKSKEKKPASEIENSHKALKSKFTTPLPAKKSKPQLSETFVNKLPVLIGYENLEDESFQRKEQKKAVELLQKLKENENRQKALAMINAIEDLKELINKSYELRMDQIEFLNEKFEETIPDIKELPAPILEFINNVK